MNDYIQLLDEELVHEGIELVTLASSIYRMSLYRMRLSGSYVFNKEVLAATVWISQI